MATPNEFLIGVNYWPSKKFVRMWKEFDAKEIYYDFSKAKEFNIGLIRFFLFWEDFQPEPKVINKRVIENLNEVLSIADKLGINTIPAIFVGHMSGPNWLPSWAISEKENDTGKVFISKGELTKNRPRNLYSDERMVEAEKFLTTELARAASNHSSIYAWDLSNEMDNIQDPTDEEALFWEKEMLKTLRAADPDHPVTHGVHIKEKRGHGFPLKVMALDDIVSVHSYPMYEGKAPTDTAYVADTITFAKTANKPTILAEFGVATNPENKAGDVSLHWGDREWKQPFVTEELQAKYVRETVEKARELGCDAALVWCFSDYNQSLYDRLPFSVLIHERYFGLFRSDGSPKPAALALKSI